MSIESLKAQKELGELRSYFWRLYCEEFYIQAELELKQQEKKKPWLNRMTQNLLENAIKTRQNELFEKWFQNELKDDHHKKPEAREEMHDS